MKYIIDLREVYKEAFFYKRWFENSKNMKTKRKLAIKTKKELMIGKEELTKRIRKNTTMKRGE